MFLPNLFYQLNADGPYSLEEAKQFIKQAYCKNHNSKTFEMKVVISDVDVILSE